MNARAFTLLEALLAIAILGVSLLGVVDINSNAVADHLYARRLTIATLLARSKITDIEQKLYDKGLPADDEEDSGDFSDDGWSSYKWRSKIVVPKTNGLSPEQLFGALFNLPLGGMGGGGKDGASGGSASSGGGMDPMALMAGLFTGGAPPGLANMLGGAGGNDPSKGADKTNGLLSMLGPAAPLAQAQFTQMVGQLQSAVREVHLTVSWKEGKLVESIDVVTHVVSLGPGSDRNGGAAAAGGSNSGSGDSYVRADNGVPVPNPQQGPGGNMVDPADGSPLVTAAQYAASHPTPGNGVNTTNGKILPGGGMPPRPGLQELRQRGVLWQ